MQRWLPRENGARRQMPDGEPRAEIYVLAGPNGAGKSSVLGAGLAEFYLSFFNPDEAARLALTERKDLTREEANSFGWHEGQRLLEEAIEQKGRFAFETTLGGRTVAARLEACLEAGGQVRMWFVCLDTPGHCVERVRARVASGGHDIDEALVRARYDAGRDNLVRLMPRLTELRMYDNSTEGDPATDAEPAPRLILHTARRKVGEVCALADVPEWAKPIVMAAVDIASN